MYDQVKKQEIKEIIIATSINKSDDKLAHHLRSLSIPIIEEIYKMLQKDF